MTIELTATNRERLRSLGLINVTTASQSARGYYAYADPETGAHYIFSPRGYVYRRSAAGTYQLNPRFSVRGNGFGTKTVSATVRTNDAGALTEIAAKGVRSYRTYAYGY